MRNIRYCILLLFILFSCDSYIPYPVLADEDALLKLQCVVGEADSTVVYVSKAYMVTHAHRPSGVYEEMLNSSLTFIVNGDTLEYKAEKDITDRYVVYHQFSAGDRIEVLCSAPGVPDVSASTVIPDVPDDLIGHSEIIKGDDYTITGKLLLNYGTGADLHLSADLHITDVYCRYEGGVLIKSDRIIHKIPLTFESNEWTAGYNLRSGHIETDPSGKVITVEVKTEAALKVNVLSKELYYWGLHQQSSTMSPSSYTNVNGGLGYVGAMNQYVCETVTFEQQ